jgi:hypothetical protein
MYIGLYVNTRYFCPISMKLDVPRQIFKKYSNNKFYKNPSSGREVVPCGQPDKQT